MVEVTVEVIIGLATPIIMVRPHTATPLRPAAGAILTAPTAVVAITIIITAITAVAIIIITTATTVETATMAATAIMVAVMVVMATAITDIIMAAAITDTETEVHRLIHRQVLLPRQARHQLPTTGVFLHRRPQPRTVKKKQILKKNLLFLFFSS